MLFDKELIGLASLLRKKITPFSVVHLSISLYPNRERMRSSYKNKPQFLKREFRFMFALASAVALLLLPTRHVNSSVIKMPKPFPDIVKSYKSVTVLAGIPGMHLTGVEVNQGDFITILAKGAIDIFPVKGNKNLYGPKGILLFFLNENDRLREYIGPEIIEIKENGDIYLGYRGSLMSPGGKPLYPENFNNDTGSFSVDIIVWKTNNPELIMRFLGQLSSSQPDDKELKELSQEFKKRQKELAALKGKEVSREKEKKKQDLPDSTSPLIKMPSPLPAIIKDFKSVTVKAGRPGMHNTGLQVRQGDFVTILSDGTINVWPENGKDFLYGPKRVLLFRLGDREFARSYRGPEVIEIPEDGNIYLGYEGSLTFLSGNPVKPEYYRDDIGAYHVDIIVWKTKDANLMAKFIQESILAKPEDKTLREISQDFRKWQEKTKETERLQKAEHALKELEDMKKKLSEREEKEAQLLARLESVEGGKSKQPRNLPVIAVAYPRDGITVDSEYINLLGVAEHEKGILRFEILINDKPSSVRNQRALKLVAKEQKRIEFSERIRLREGQNKIAIFVQGEDGLINQKSISVQLVMKREEVYAVVIGINKYKNLPSLKYAVNDAREFYRYLVEVNKIPKNHVWLLLDEEATLDKMKSTLGTSLRQNAGKDDTVIIFLAGHGATEHDASSPDGDGLEKYILPYNANPKDLYASALPMSEIARIFQRIGSERLVFISDTCYSGASGGRTIPVAGRRANVSGAFWERLSQGKGRVILTASDANEVSVEKDDLKHGVFTYYLLEGLRGKADMDRDGMITVDEVYRYVSVKVSQATGQNQHPVKKGETTGQIVLGVVR